MAMRREGDDIARDGDLATFFGDFSDRARAGDTGEEAARSTGESTRGAGEPTKGADGSRGGLLSLL